MHHSEGVKLLENQLNDGFDLVFNLDIIYIPHQFELR